jgi:8-oxo-dGTP pyrophosphatase MutT (NUDIX family)
VKVALNTLSLTLYMDRNQFNIQTHFFIRQCIFFSEFKPVTKNNMGYIVSAVVVNEANQVLMIQEAKYSCHGTWYLPAGRVEKNEDLVVRVLEREL